MSKERRLHRFIIWSKPFLFGWLLAFPLYGPVILHTAPVQAFYGFPLVLIFLFFHCLSFLLGSFLIKDINLWYKIMIRSLIVTIAANLSLFFSYTWVWPIGMAVMGVSSALYILGWCCLFSLSADIINRIKIMSLVIILGNLVLLLFNQLTIILSPKIVLASTIIPLVIALLILLRFPYSPNKVLKRPAISRTLPKPLLLIFALFIFLIYINGGFLYNIMLPRLEMDFAFSSYFSILIYILVLLFIYFYKKNLQHYFPLYLGVSFLGLAFVSFSLLNQTLSGFFITTGLIQAAFALLDLFVWATLSILSFIYMAPFQFFGITMSATTASILFGNLIGDKLLLIGEEHYLFTAVFAAASIFLVIIFMPWLNQHIDKSLSLVLNTEQHRTVKLEDIPISRLKQHLNSGEKLTPKETEIILLILKGLTNNDIAQQLYISQNTLKSHMKNIYNKFGVRKKRELIYLSTSKEGSGFNNSGQ